MGQKYDLLLGYNLSNKKKNLKFILKKNYLVYNNEID